MRRHRGRRLAGDAGGGHDVRRRGRRCRRRARPTPARLRRRPRAASTALRPAAATALAARAGPADCRARRFRRGADCRARLRGAMVRDRADQGQVIAAACGVLSLLVMSLELVRLSDRRRSRLQRRSLRRPISTRPRTPGRRSSSSTDPAAQRSSRRSRPPSSALVGRRRAPFAPEALVFVLGALSTLLLFYSDPRPGARRRAASSASILGFLARGRDRGRRLDRRCRTAAAERRGRGAVPPAATSERRADATARAAARPRRNRARWFPAIAGIALLAVDVPADLVRRRARRSSRRSGGGADPPAVRRARGGDAGHRATTPGTALELRRFVLLAAGCRRSRADRRPAR